MALMIRKAKNDHRGVSLLEIVVVIGIAVFIFFIIADIFIAHNRLFHIQSVLADTEINNFFALNRMQKIIKSADRALVNKTINSIQYNASDNTLILEMPSIDNNQNIIPDTFDYAIFHLDPQDSAKLILSMEANAGSSRYSGDTLISSFVDKIIFSYDANDFSKVNLISIYLANSRTIFGSTQKTTASTSATLRNFQ